MHPAGTALMIHHLGLNESPSEKEGKFQTQSLLHTLLQSASMKVPPKRKGNS